MNQPSKDIVYFKFYNIEEEQFLRILARVTTTVVNIHFNQQFSIQHIYKHIAFKYGDITNLHVPNLILVC